MGQLSQDKIREALEEFCHDIEQTGGIIPNPEGDATFVPDADHEWVDLADTYVKACRALGRSPKRRKVC
jgi:hypothetical protein